MANPTGMTGFVMAESRHCPHPHFLLMSEILPTVDFGRIRTYDGAQSGGFEQLAVEFFAREQGLSRQLVRVNGAGGDGGVEAYTDIAGRGTLGMQAEYFNQLGDTQWKQIDKSVKTALSQYPNLNEYRVYVPLDRTKGRLGKTEGQIEKWNKLVEAWHKLANGADVEFIWLGRNEIELALKNAEHHDLLFYWFGTPQFGDDWRERLLKASLQTLGGRYQPERHIDESASRELDRFVWSPSCERVVERGYVEIAEACLSFRQNLPNLPLMTENEGHRAVVQKAIDGAVRSEYPAYGHRRIDQIRPPAQALFDSIHELASHLRNQNANTADQRDVNFNSGLYSVDQFAKKVRNWVDLLDDYGDADFQCALVRGDAGSGKSHLIAHCAVQAGQRKQPVLLVLGEQFLGDRPPLTQLCEQIGWSGGPTSLLSALNVAGSLARRPALLFIDALNESSERRLWKSYLHSVASKIRRYPHVRLVVSCRSDYVGITMPQDFKTGVSTGWGLIHHRGFGDVLAKAVARYFKSYNIQSPHFPPLLDEFRNPLFLDTFCRAFENRILPDGPITLRTVMEHRIERLAEKLQVDINCDAQHVRQAIRDLAEKIRDNNGTAVEERVARAVIEPHSPSAESSRSLYTHLLSNGVIVERVDGYWEENPTVFVRFAFERFSDYFITRGLLSGVADVAALRGLIRDGCRLAWTRACNTYLDNRGVARALSVLVPEQLGIELIDLLPGAEHNDDILSDLLDSLPWRSGASITESTKTRVMEASRCVSTTLFIETLLRVSTIPNHPFNAGFLHAKLAAMELPLRDAIWTIPISQSAAEDNTVPSTLVEWAIQVSRNLVSDD